MNEENDRLAQLPTIPVICAGGFVLRQREWAERGNECLGESCPYPDTCEIKNLAKKESEQK